MKGVALVLILGSCGLTEDARDTGDAMRSEPVRVAFDLHDPGGVPTTLTLTYTAPNGEQGAFRRTTDMLAELPGASVWAAEPPEGSTVTAKLGLQLSPRAYQEIERRVVRVKPGDVLVIGDQAQSLPSDCTYEQPTLLHDAGGPYYWTDAAARDIDARVYTVKSWNDTATSTDHRMTSTIDNLKSTNVPYVDPGVPGTPTRWSVIVTTFKCETSTYDDLRARLVRGWHCVDGGVRVPECNYY